MCALRSDVDTALFLETVERLISGVIRTGNDAKIANSSLIRSEL